MKRVQLELGGNAPFIIFESADLDLAVSHVIASKFRCSGQVLVFCYEKFLVWHLYFTQIKLSSIRVNSIFPSYRLAFVRIGS